jgi:hypothetical protein
MLEQLLNSFKLLNLWLLLALLVKYSMDFYIYGLAEADVT